MAYVALGVSSVERERKARRIGLHPAFDSVATKIGIQDRGNAAKLLQAEHDPPPLLPTRRPAVPQIVRPRAEVLSGPLGLTLRTVMGPALRHQFAPNRSVTHVTRLSRAGVDPAFVLITTIAPVGSDEVADARPSGFDRA